MKVSHHFYKHCAPTELAFLKHAPTQRSSQSEEVSYPIGGNMKRGLAAILLLALCSTSLSAADRSFLVAAQAAANWIRAAAVRTERGTAYLADPNDQQSVAINLYSGVPSVVLFFLEAYHSTGDPTYLQDARAGAYYLIAHLADEQETGLYEGV